MVRPQSCSLKLVVVPHSDWGRQNMSIEVAPENPHLQGELVLLPLALWRVLTMAASWISVHHFSSGVASRSSLTDTSRFRLAAFPDPTCGVLWGRLLKLPWCSWLHTTRSLFKLRWNLVSVVWRDNTWRRRSGQSQEDLQSIPEELSSALMLHTNYNKDGGQSVYLWLCPVLVIIQSRQTSVQRSFFLSGVHLVDHGLPESL